MSSEVISSSTDVQSIVIEPKVEETTTIENDVTSVEQATTFVTIPGHSADARQTKEFEFAFKNISRDIMFEALSYLLPMEDERETLDAPALLKLLADTCLSNGIRLLLNELQSKTIIEINGILKLPIDSLENVTSNAILKIQIPVICCYSNLSLKLIVTLICVFIKRIGIHIIIE
jgi:hypothetical protein